MALKVIIPDRLALAPQGATPSTPAKQLTFGFADISASEFRGGRYEVCHYQKKSLGAADGPLSIDQMLTFICELGARMKNEKTFVVIKYDLKERKNVAVLVGAFLVLWMRWSTAQVYSVLEDEACLLFPCSWISHHKLATKAGAPRMRVRDCWSGVEMARNFGWIPDDAVQDEVKSLLAATKFWKTVCNYDGSWLVPGEIFIMGDPVTVVKDPNPVTCDSILPPQRRERKLVTTESLHCPHLSEAGSEAGESDRDEEEDGPGKAGDETVDRTSCSGADCNSSESTEKDLDAISVHSVCKAFAKTGSTESFGKPRTSQSLWPKADALLSFFEEQGIGMMVRANMSHEPGLVELGGSYSVEHLSRHGVKHEDVQFDDTNGAVPTPAIVRRFLSRVEGMGFQPSAAPSHSPSTSPDRVHAVEAVKAEEWAHDNGGARAIVIHCKSGFGRSALLACLLVVYHYDVPGRPLLGWCRIARPGSITTPEQEAFLCSLMGRADLCKRIGLPQAGGGGGAGQACCALQ